MYGIYIHIPFCIRKCNYCDFASYPDKIHMQTEYISALIDEMSKRKGEMVDTVYIGGGTPSVLSYENTERLLCEVNNTFSLSSDCEFTVEINPKTIDNKKARLFKRYGVNRISIGSQTFVDSELSVLGRIHTSADTWYTYSMLKDEGFENISLDLMYALPYQTMDTLSKSIDRVLKLNPEHISCYGLKFEEGTPFYEMLLRGNINEASDDTFADMYSHIMLSLKEAGYIHYEISNFAKEGRESRHNLKYWQDKDYLGFGVASSSKEQNRRYTHVMSLDGYLKGEAFLEDYTMDIKEQMSEFIILGLRVINSGVDKRLFKDKFGVELDEVFKRALDRVDPYVINTKTSLKLRQEALLVSNSIMCEFMEI